jgi:signal-transduction protein with cAMP-binding, CBS, and nucleotidyltransferase domain
MRRTRSNLPNEVVDTGLGYRLAWAIEPARDRNQIVTARSPSRDHGPDSVPRVDATDLDAIPLFAGLTLDQRESVARMCQQLEVEAGETLVKEGDFGFAAFAITSGTADVFQDGTVLRALGPGDMFGEIAVLSGGRRTATVVATSPMTLVTVLNRDMWRLEREHPDIASALRNTINERLGASSASG